MLDKYEEISSASGDQGMINELFDLGREAGLPDKLIDFLITQDITINKKKTTSWKEDLKSSLVKNFVYSSEITTPQTKYHSYKVTRFMNQLVMAPMFNTFIFV